MNEAFINTKPSPSLDSATLYLHQFITAKQFPRATHRSFRKNRADVVMSTAGFKTDAQPTALTELLHLSHL